MDKFTFFTPKPCCLLELYWDQMGTAKEKRGRKVKRGLLAKTGGLCPSLDQRLLPWAN